MLHEEVGSYRTVKDTEETRRPMNSIIVLETAVTGMGMFPFTAPKIAALKLIAKG